MLQILSEVDALTRNKILEQIKVRQKMKTLSKTTPEARYNMNKRQWMFHESIWYRRGLNKYDWTGCNQFTSCIPEC
jgi:hypothetical protein